MIGTLIGAGIGAVGSAISAIASKNATERANNALLRELDYNKAWYDRRYNEDATAKADAQRAYNMVMERIKANNKAAMSTDATMGTDMKNRVREQSAQTVANLLADTAARGADDKERVDSQYERNRKAIVNQQMANTIQSAANIGAAGQGLAQAAVGAGQAYDAYKQQGEYNKIMELLLGGKKEGKA